MGLAHSQRLSFWGEWGLGRPWGWVGGAGSCGVWWAPPGGEHSLGGPYWALASQSRSLPSLFDA